MPALSYRSVWQIPHSPHIIAIFASVRRFVPLSGSRSRPETLRSLRTSWFRKAAPLTDPAPS